IYDLWFSYALFVCVHLTLHCPPSKLAQPVKGWPRIFNMAKTGWAFAEILRLLRREVERHVDLGEAASKIPRAEGSAQVGGVYDLNIHKAIIQMGDEVLYRVFHYKKTDRAYKQFVDRVTRHPEATVRLYARR